MAGDWIKMEVGLPLKPEVWQMAGMLGIDADSVVGKLLKVWAWFDTHTTDGNAVGVSYPLLDSVAGVIGFAEAMALCGWLRQNGSVVTLPNFSRHNGKTAKNRALTNDRVAKHRAESNALSNADSVTKTVTREEKRREEYKEESARLEPESEFKPTPLGAACKAMRQAGLSSVNPGDPRLIALIDQGATVEEFIGLAAEAVSKGKGFAWVMHVLAARREEAAKLKLAPVVESGPSPMLAESEARRKREAEHAKASQSAEAHAARKLAMEAIGIKR